MKNVETIFVLHWPAVVGGDNDSNLMSQELVKKKIGSYIHYNFFFFESRWIRLIHSGITTGKPWTKKIF